MTPNYQDENNQSPVSPDYSFITEQPVIQGRPNNGNRKVVILIMSVVVLLVLFIVLSVSSGVKNTGKTGDQEVLVQEFLELSRSNKDNDAYALLAPAKQKEASQEQFTKLIVSPLRDSYKLGDCVATGTLNQKDIVNVTCPTKTTNTEVKFIFAVNTINNQLRIVDYELVGPTNAQN